MIKAIIVVPGSPALPMGQLLDRPFLQHLVEQLAGRGVAHIRLILHRAQRDISALLGDGSRWGIAIECRYTEETPGWHDLAVATLTDSNGLVLVGNASRLPYLPDSRQEGAIDGAWPAIFFDEDNTRPRWVEWILLKEKDVAAFAGHLSRGADWREALREESQEVHKIFLDHQHLSCASPKELLLSNRAALEGAFPGLFFAGKQVRDGVWIARAAKIPPTARIQSPCYIGEESWIGPNCELGPHAVIGPRCVISSGTHISRSVVAESTYLGPELEVADSFVASSRIHNVRLGADIEIGENHIACSMAATQAPWWKRWGKDENRCK
jgi:hypothetical protein